MDGSKTTLISSTVLIPMNHMSTSIIDACRFRFFRLLKVEYTLEAEAQDVTGYSWDIIHSRDDLQISVSTDLS